MQRFALTLVVLSIQSGCTASLVTTPMQLEGSWGGEHVGMSDSVAARGVLISIGCVTALFPAPIAVDSAGTFQAFGAVTWATYPPNIGRRTRVSGRVVGDSLALDWTWAVVSNPDQFEPSNHYQLTFGHAPNWSGLVCTA